VSPVALVAIVSLLVVAGLLAMVARPPEHALVPDPEPGPLPYRVRVEKRAGLWCVCQAGDWPNDELVATSTTEENARLIATCWNAYWEAQ